MPQISRIADVAWLDATELLVLGAADSNTAYAPFRVVEDASRITKEGEPENWNAVELAVLPRTQTAIIVGSADGVGQTWKDNGSQWVPFVDKMSAPSPIPAKCDDCPQIAPRESILTSGPGRLSR